MGIPRHIGYTCSLSNDATLFGFSYNRYSPARQKFLIRAHRLSGPDPHTIGLAVNREEAAHLLAALKQWVSEDYLAELDAEVRRDIAEADKPKLTDIKPDDGEGLE